MAMIKYSLLRLALLAVAFTALWLVGARGLLWLIGGVLLAWALSYVVLRRSRDDAALWLADRSRRRAAGEEFGVPRGVAHDAEVEDAEADEIAARGLAQDPENLPQDGR